MSFFILLHVYIYNNGWKCKLDETNASIVMKSIFNLKGPFCKHIFIFKNLIAFIDVHFKANKDLSIIYTMYTNASNNTPFYIHISLHIIWRIHHLGEFAR